MRNSQISLFHCDIFVLAAVSFLVAASFSEGAIVQFSSLGSWQASAGPITFSEDFNSFVVDTPFRIADGPLALNGFTLVESGSETENLNLVDLPPLMNLATDVNGTPFASIAIDLPSSTVDLRFSQPARGFGANFSDIKSPEIANIDFYRTDGSLIATIDPTPTNGFIGFVATGNESIGYVRFYTTLDLHPNIREAFGIDNVVIASVPEPNTIAALIVTALSLCLARRKRRTRQSIKVCDNTRCTCWR